MELGVTNHMRLKQMSDQELGTLVYWEISRSMRCRPGSTPTSFIAGLKVVDDRLGCLNPARLVAKRLNNLRNQMIEGPADEKDFDEMTIG